VRPFVTPQNGPKWLPNRFNHPVLLLGDRYAIGLIDPLTGSA
jgi:hypothetical protein